ncbi:MAG: lamin tail domain-containing protein [Planctomycetes bacterium]|nr:lamin tail domain-containing protein [Planctomycetota bacterium]
MIFSRVAPHDRAPLAACLRLLRRGVWSTLALGATLVEARAQVVLSQVYGGGGNTGATYEADFVELYNAGAPQSLAGWSVQYASGTGGTWQVTPLPAVVLGTGRYFLVRQATGSTVVAPQALELPPADANGSIAFSATDGKLALCNVVTPLAGTQPSSAQIVDFVGFGALASFNEPGAPFSNTNNAPSPSASLAIFRASCGALDSHNSRADWAVGLPAPRNSTVAPSSGLGAGVMVQPHFAERGQSVRIVCEPFACANLALGTALSVNVDLTPIGGVPLLALLDDGTNGDALAGDGLFTRDVTIPVGANVGTMHLPLSLAGNGTSGGGFASLNVMAFSTPDNDNCVNALALVGPYTPAVQIAGNFTGATVEYNVVLSSSTSNPGNMGSRRGLWYAVTGSGSTLTADTCASPLIGGTTIPDTVMMIFAGAPEDLMVVAANDDAPAACGAGSGTERRSRTSWCTVAGATYYIWVAPFAPTPAPTFQFVLTITDDGLACSGAYTPASCTPAASGALEGEPMMGPASNDGCDSSPGVFCPANPGLPTQVFHGTARSFGNSRDTDWYRFQASSSDVFTATLNAQFSGLLELHELSATGTCTGSVLLQSSALSGMCTTTELSSVVSAGHWYAVRVVPLGNTPPGAPVPVFGGIAPGAASAHYRLELTLGDAPANDSCGQAEALTFGVRVTGQTNAATSIDAPTTCDPIGRDVWYRVDLDVAGGIELDTCGSAIDTALALFDACGGNELACNDQCGGAPCGAPGACLSVPSLSAGSYWIRVSDRGVVGNFSLLARFVHLNDECAGATAIAAPSVTFGSTVGAAPETGLPTALGPIGVQDFTATSPAVWYSITLPGTPGSGDRTLYVDTLTASFDTKLSVYVGSCGALSPVTANDDIDASFRSKVGFRATAGVTYFVLVHGFNTSVGTYELRVSDFAPLANDDCVAALDVGPESGTLAGSFAGATGEISSYSATDLSSCASDFTVFDVWYRFSATCDTTLALDTCGATDTILSVHSDCPSAVVANEIAGACSDDAAQPCAPGSQLALPVLSGSSYWIRVASKHSVGALGSFTLHWSTTDSDGDGVEDCLDGCASDPAKSAPGTCGCGVSELDSDADGTPDCVDGCPSDPLKSSPGVCGCGVADSDTDGDGILDCLDGCPLDPDKLVPGVCGCGVSELDSDGDGTPDCVDTCPLDPAKTAPGVCGCGVADADSDGDGVFDCLDGCPLDPNKLAPGACGCGVSELDSDGDGAPDCIDQCPLDPAKTAPGVCGCGVADTDTDLDGVADCGDNCPALANPDQADCDFDGVGDTCEIAAGAFDTNLDTIPDACQTGLVFAYCTAGTSSNGCVPSLASTGVPHATASSGFVLQCTSLEGQRAALFFYGLGGPVAQSWGAGSSSFKCVRSPVQRMTPANSGGTAGTCNGTLAVDFNAYALSFPGALGMPLAPGVVVGVQAWYRDPAAPQTTNLSHALQFTVAP